MSSEPFFRRFVFLIIREQKFFEFKEQGLASLNTDGRRFRKSTPSFLLMKTRIIINFAMAFWFSSESTLGWLTKLVIHKCEGPIILFSQKLSSQSTWRSDFRFSSKPELGRIFRRSTPSKRFDWAVDFRDDYTVDGRGLLYINSLQKLE